MLDIYFDCHANSTTNYSKVQTGLIYEESSNGQHTHHILNFVGFHIASVVRGPEMDSWCALQSQGFVRWELSDTLTFSGEIFLTQDCHH